MTTIEKLALIDGPEGDCRGADSARMAGDDLDLDLERVIWDEEYRRGVMQVLNGRPAR